MTKALKNFLIITPIVIILAIFTVTVLMYDSSLYLREKNYNEAIKCAENGEFFKAMDKLKEVNKDECISDSYNNLFCNNDDLYKNSYEIYCYAYASSSLLNDPLGADLKLDEIDYFYNGKFKDEIKQLKKDIIPYVDEYLEKEQRKLTETYADRIPFVGMPDKYINYTLAGKPSDIKTEKGNYQNQGYSAKNTYIWNGSDGYIALKAESKDGIVTFVEKYNEKYYWTSDGKPNFSASLPKKKKVYRYAPPRSDKKEDPYNAKDYSSYEDFYEDYEEEFDGLDDAESYYEEYGE